MNGGDPIDPTDSTLEVRETDTGENDRTAGSLTAVSPPEPTDETADESSQIVTPRFLTALRENRRRRTVAIVAAAAIGVALAWIHWLGLFVAGSLVGLASATVPRALVAGAGVGLLVLLVNVWAVPTMAVGEFVRLAPVSYVTIVASLVAPLWGSLVRGVV